METSEGLCHVKEVIKAPIPNQGPQHILFIVLFLKLSFYLVLQK